MLRALPAALLACATLLLACGDSGGSEGSEERFLSDGDKLCNRLGERSQALAKQRVAGNARDLVRNASAYRDLTRDLSTGFAAMRVPAGDADARRIVRLAAGVASSARAQKVRAKRLSADTERGSVAAVNRGVRSYNSAASRMKRSFADPLDRAMRAYGFKNCGRSS